MLLSTVQMAVWRWRPDSDTVIWETADGAKSSSFASGRMKFESFIEHVHPEDRTLVTALLHRATEACMQFKCAFRYRTPERGYRELSMLGRVEEGVEGHPSLYGLVSDITDRHTSSGTDLLDSMFRQATEPVVVVNDLSQVVGWNKAASKAFGVLQADALGSALVKVLPLERSEQDRLVSTLGSLNGACLSQKLTFSNAQEARLNALRLHSGEDGGDLVCLLFNIEKKSALSN